MKKLSFIFLLFIFLIKPCFSQDQIVNARNSYVQMTNPNGPSGTVPWSTLANQIYLLTGQTPDSGFCVSIVNNNPTSSHSFVVTVFQTGDSQVTDYSHNTGRYSQVNAIGSTNTISPVSPSTTNYFFVHTNAAAKVAFVFTGATTQAGNPDTVDIYAVQTTSQSCGPVNANTGQNFTLSTPNVGTGAATPLQVISDGNQSAYYGSQFFTNPAANTALLYVNSNTNNTKTLYFDQAIISCDATCNVGISFITGLGTGCTTIGTIPNERISFVTNPSVAVANAGCTTIPVIGVVFINLYLAAGQPFTFDARGIIAPSNGNNGLMVYMIGALTGHASATMKWYEK